MKYYFNTLHDKLNKMERKTNDLKILIQALGLAGLSADTKSLTLILHMKALVDKMGEDISLKDISELTAWVGEMFPQTPPSVPEGQAA